MSHFNDEEEEKVMSTEEAIVFLADQLKDETVCSEAYREAAIALLDHIAQQAVDANERHRAFKRQHDDEIMNIHPPISGATH